MARNGASARAASGNGRWGAAEEGIGRSSAWSRGEGWIWWMDGEGAAPGGSVEEEQEEAAGVAGQKRPKLANPGMGAACDFQSSSLLGGAGRGEGPSSASVGFPRSVGEAILPAGCAARAMGGQHGRDLHISGEKVAIDEMMLK
jgi:hypothetical protein